MERPVTTGTVAGRRRRIEAHDRPVGNPVVTGRQSGLQASGGRRIAKKNVGAGVMTRC